MASQRCYIIYNDTDDETKKIVKRYKKQLSKICPSFGSDGRSRVAERIRLLMASTWVVVLWDRATDNGVYCYELYTAIYFATINKMTNIIYLLPDGTPVLLKDELPWCFKQIVMADTWLDDLGVELRPDPPGLDEGGSSGIAGAFKKLVPSGDSNLTSPGGITKHLRTFLNSVHVRNDYYAILTEWVKGTKPKELDEDVASLNEVMVEVEPTREPEPVAIVVTPVEEISQNLDDNNLAKETEEQTPSTPEPATASSDALDANVVADPPPANHSHSNGVTSSAEDPAPTTPARVRVTVTKSFMDTEKTLKLDRLRHLTYVILGIHIVWYVGLCSFLFISYYHDTLVIHFGAFLLLLDVVYITWNVIYYKLCKIQIVHTSYALLLLIEIYACCVYAVVLYLVRSGTLTREDIGMFENVKVITWSFVGLSFVFGKCAHILSTMYLTCNRYALLNTQEALLM